MFVTKKGLALCIIPVITAFGIMSGVQLLTRGAITTAPHGSLFILARNLEDGPAREYLLAVCPNEKYRLCQYLNELNRHSNWFLWEKDSPLYKIGVNEVNREAKHILFESFKDNPVIYIQVALDNTLKQFFRYDTATWVRPYIDEKNSITRIIKKHFQEYYGNEYFNTLQNRNLLRIGFLKELQYIVTLIAMVVSFLALFFLNSKGHSFYLKLFISMWLALIGNAFICGALSIVTDRYQSRVVWLVMLLVLLAYFGMKSNAHKDD